MIRALLPLLATLLLCACASAPKRDVTVTLPSGKSYKTVADVVEDPRTHADGSRMDWVELAVVKVNGGLPADPEPTPLWSCLAADLATTGVGLSVGLTEANPLGLYAIPLNVAQIHYAKKWEEEGDPYAAKVYCFVHRAAAVWNLAMILLIL